jgi:hypothetical protein
MRLKKCINASLNCRRKRIQDNLIATQIVLTM